MSVDGGVEGFHFMSSDVLGYVFTSMSKQDQSMGNTVRDAKHTTAEKWKAGLDKFKDKTVDQLEQHNDC